MRNADLIAALAEYPADAEVFIPGADACVVDTVDITCITTDGAIILPGQHAAPGALITLSPR